MSEPTYRELMRIPGFKELTNLRVRDMQPFFDWSARMREAGGYRIVRKDEPGAELALWEVTIHGPLVSDDGGRGRWLDCEYHRTVYALKPFDAACVAYDLRFEHLAGRRNALVTVESKSETHRFLLVMPDDSALVLERNAAEARDAWPGLGLQ